MLSQRPGLPCSIFAFAALAGCDSGAEDPTPAAFVIDAQAIAAGAVAYDQGELVLVSLAAVPSQHSGDDVRVWVSRDAEAAYRAIREDTSAAAPFPVGTMIVKEQRKADGALDVLTTMVKGPAGYAPASDDWHWQRVTPDGAITHQGQVDFCIACHTPRADSADWTFGVPAANQTR